MTLPNPGQPQTILIIGSDHRAGEAFKAANTDTMLLVRLNGSSQTINVISVPRDLKARMDKVSASVNWSQVAAQAFEAKLLELESKKEVSGMDDVIARLRAAAEIGLATAVRGAILLCFVNDQAQPVD